MWERFGAAGRQVLLPIKVLKGYDGRLQWGSGMKEEPQAIRAFALDYPREKSVGPEDTMGEGVKLETGLATPPGGSFWFRACK